MDAVKCSKPIAHPIVLGILILLLFGPALALLKVVLVLAVVLGLLLLPLLAVAVPCWLCYRILRRLCAEGRQLSQWAGFRCRNTAAAIGSRPCYRAGRAAGTVLENGRDIGLRVGGILLEALSGSVILAVLAGLLSTNLPGWERGRYILLGALVGIVWGFLIGLANYLPPRQRAESCDPAG